VTLVHWDDVEGFDIPGDLQPLGGRWQRLADAAGSVGLGGHRVQLEPGQMITPPHQHSTEEEIFSPAYGLGDALAGRRDMHRRRRACCRGRASPGSQTSPCSCSRRVRG
jgi:hypothetical protein